MDRLIQANAQYHLILQEYQMLFLKRHLTGQDANRLDQILDQAMEDASLGLLIDELDHALGHPLNMIDALAVEQTRCDLMKLLDKGHIGDMIASIPALQDAQKRLEKKGYYQGKIDGVYGSKTQAAFQKLRESIEMLSPQVISAEIQQLLEIENQFNSFC